MSYSTLPFGPPELAPAAIPGPGGTIGGVTTVPIAPSGSYKWWDFTTPPPGWQMPAANNASGSGGYNPGPFCFGLDKYICPSLPGAGVCRAVLNALCGLTVTVILLVMLGLVVGSLL